MISRRTFTIDSDISAYIDETKRDLSPSDRFNELLRLAMLQERNQRLEAEAAEFFADARAGRTGTKDFQRASLQTFRR
jgi:hypothetical protein